MNTMKYYDITNRYCDGNISRIPQNVAVPYPTILKFIYDNNKW